MSKENFKRHFESSYAPNSGIIRSYIKGIELLDDIFRQEDFFGLNGISIFNISDIDLLLKIHRFVKEEEIKAKNNRDSILKYFKANQESYLRNRYCSAGIYLYITYVSDTIYLEEFNKSMVKQTSGTSLSATLQTKFSIDKKGLDVLSEEKHRIGQTYFRKMILSIYENKCCITGLCIPEILLASHITEWAKDERNRLNPRNGLCLSATYDSAFDKHLITLDEDYRVIVSPTIKQYYDKASVQQYFQHIEGQRISLPIAYAPDQRLLAKHREQLR